MKTKVIKYFCLLILIVVISGCDNLNNKLYTCATGSSLRFHNQSKFTYTVMDQVFEGSYSKVDNENWSGAYFIVTNRISVEQKISFKKGDGGITVTSNFDKGTFYALQTVSKVDAIKNFIKGFTEKE